MHIMSVVCTEMLFVLELLATTQEVIRA